MSEGLAAGIVLAVAIYLALGLLFAIAFVLRGVGAIDPQATAGSWGFRVLIVPGVAVFWPLLLDRWRRGASPPSESNPHRDAASLAGHGDEASEPGRSSAEARS